jgi:DNA protecting protein DprA
MYNMPVQEIVVDKFYPLLWAMPEYDRPTILYARGNTSLLREIRTCAFTGTRTPTDGGLARTETIAMFFAENDVVIIAGNCHGIDTAAQEGALAGGGKVIVVLPHSLNKEDLYEKQNESLLNQIIKTGGLIITEYKEGKADKSRFFERNRIIAGLGRIVIPGQLRELNSGTGHTVQKGEEYGRYIMVPRPDPEEPLHDGARELLKHLDEPGFTPDEYDDMLSKLEELAVILPQPKHIAELYNIANCPKSIVDYITQNPRNLYKLEDIQSIVANVELGTDHYWIVKLNQKSGGYYYATEVHNDVGQSRMGVEALQCAQFIKDEIAQKHLIAQLKGVVPFGERVTIPQAKKQPNLIIHMASLSDRNNHHGSVHMMVTHQSEDSKHIHNIPGFAPDSNDVFGHKLYDALLEKEQARTKAARERAEKEIERWKRNTPVNDDEFRERYFAKLDQIDIDKWIQKRYQEAIAYKQQKGEVKHFTLCCYCNKDKRFCHRFLLAEWLIKRIKTLDLAIEIQVH